ncbi:MAG: hypothetical protein AAGE94_11725 [Acidobacteriota bacterium]
MPNQPHHRSRHSRAIVLAILLTTVAASMLGAAPIPIGPEQQINQITTGRQLRADVAVFADGSGIVVWEGEDGDGRGIVGRRVDATGAPSGADFAVSTVTTDDQINTRVATTAANGFVVVWENDTSGGDPSIGSRFFDAAGVGDPAVDVVAAQVDIGVSLPEIVEVEAGRFVVTWESYDYGTNASAIRGRRLTDAGAVDGLAFDVATAPVGQFVFKGSTAPRSADGFVVAWRLDAADRTLHAQRFDATGGTAGALATVVTSDISDPRIAGLDADAFLVVWDTNSAQLQRRRQLGDGTLQAQVDLDASDVAATDASVIALPGGGAAIAWAEIDGIDRRIRVQTLDGSDAVTDTWTVDDTNLTVSDPRLAYDASRGELMVVWTRRGGTGTDQEELYSRRYALDGLFADGFDDGNTDQWSATSGNAR